MREFFIDDVVKMPFTLFGWIHFLCFIITVIGLFYIYINRHKITNLSFRTKRIIEWVIITIMFVNMKLYYIPLLIYNRYDWKEHLPFHFCFIAGYLFMYMLLTNNKKLHRIIYFFAFMGPIPAIIWPDVKSSFDSFLFYQYFISHHFFLLSNFFLFYVYNQKLNFNDLKKAFIYANLIFMIMAIFNFIFKTNYIMSNSFPPHILDLFPFLSKVDYPFIILELVAILMLFIAYLPIYLKNKENNI